MDEEMIQINTENILTLDKSVLMGQPSTDDEIHLESREPLVNTEVDVKKKNKKNRREQIIDDFVVVVPDVDLISNAYIAPQELSTESLAKKKE